MRSRQNILSVSGQRVCLHLLCFIFFKGCTANDMITASTHAWPGQNVSLHCTHTTDITVAQVQWSRFNNSAFVVFNPLYGIHIHDPEYKNRISINKHHTLTLKQVREEDFGPYCCHLSTYPSGSLKRCMQLLKDDKKDGPKESENQHQGLSPEVMTYIYIACGIVAIVLLSGIIVAICKKRRRKVQTPKEITRQTANEPTSQPSEKGKGQASPHTGMQRNSRMRDASDDDDMYLNVIKP